ncbi:MAG: methyltransferase domain-containing protein [Bacteroidota bacterium]
MKLRRSYQTELMDDFAIQNGTLTVALKELLVINKYLGGDSSSRRALKNFPAGSSLLDIGAGAGNITGDNLSVDRNPAACRFSKMRSPGLHVICADALFLPFREKSVEIIHCSLFLHHFHENSIAELLSNFKNVARTAIIINDLHRSRTALAGIRILTALLSKSRMVKHDAPLSVLRGFTKRELILIIERAGIRNYDISHRWAFRWLVTIYL